MERSSGCLLAGPLLPTFHASWHTRALPAAADRAASPLQHVRQPCWADPELLDLGRCRATRGLGPGFGFVGLSSALGWLLHSKAPDTRPRTRRAGASAGCTRSPIRASTASARMSAASGPRPASDSAAATSKASIRTPRLRNWSIKVSMRARVYGSALIGISHPLPDASAILCGS